MNLMTYKERIPAEARFIMERLQAAGYEAYLVGGAVRDLILGRQPCFGILGRWKSERPTEPSG